MCHIRAGLPIGPSARERSHCADGRDGQKLAAGPVLPHDGRCPPEPSRLDFLDRGQGCVAGRIREALARIPEGELRDRPLVVQDSHMIEIAACEARVLSMRKSPSRCLATGPRRRGWIIIPDRRIAAG
jgi:hypothetical protein